jgi:hypothetical protein
LVLEEKPNSEFYLVTCHLFEPPCSSTEPYLMSEADMTKLASDLNLSENHSDFMALDLKC